MCGRFTGLTLDEILETIAVLEQGGTFEPRDDEAPNARADAYPGSTVNLIIPSDDVLTPASLQWGYAVDWQKQPLFNTRIESALSGSGMWADSIRNRRCIVPALGYFESHGTETVKSSATGRAVKRPYRFRTPGAGPTFLAGIWQDDRFSLMTTQANGWAAPVHHRMPLALHPAEVYAWLWGDYASLADRSAFELVVEPQGVLLPSRAASEGRKSRGDDAASPEQLSLF